MQSSSDVYTIVNWALVSKQVKTVQLILEADPPGFELWLAQKHLHDLLLQ